MPRIFWFISIFGLMTCQKDFNQYMETFNVVWNTIKPMMGNSLLIEDVKKFDTYKKIINGLFKQEIDSRCHRFISNLMNEIEIPQKGEFSTIVGFFDMALQLDGNLIKKGEDISLTQCYQEFIEFIKPKDTVVKILHNIEEVGKIFSDPNKNFLGRFFMTIIMRDFHMLGVLIRELYEAINILEFKDNIDLYTFYQVDQKMACFQKIYSTLQDTTQIDLMQLAQKTLNCITDQNTHETSTAPEEQTNNQPQENIETEESKPEEIPEKFLEENYNEGQLGEKIIEEEVLSKFIYQDL